MFRWYLRDWYNAGVGVAIVVLARGVPNSLSALRQILLLSFAVLCLHEVEEYRCNPAWPPAWPG